MAVEVVHARNATQAAIDAAIVRAKGRAMVFIPGPAAAPLSPRPGLVRPAQTPRPSVSARAAATRERVPAKPALRVDPAATIRLGAYVVSGYAARFNQPTRNANKAGERRMFRPGAFGRAIARGGVVLLQGHHGSLGAYDPARLRMFSFASQLFQTLSLREDDRGLWIEASIEESDRGRALYTAVKNGGASGMSCGWLEGGRSRLESDMRVYDEVDLCEVSILLAPDSPAWPGTSIRAVGPLIRGAA